MGTFLIQVNKGIKRKQPLPGRICRPFFHNKSPSVDRWTHTVDRCLSWNHRSTEPHQAVDRFFALNRQAVDISRHRSTVCFTKWSVDRLLDRSTVHQKKHTIGRPKARIGRPFLSPATKQNAKYTTKDTQMQYTCIDCANRAETLIPLKGNGPESAKNVVRCKGFTFWNTHSGSM